jgi:hypothetical protein
MPVEFCLRVSAFRVDSINEPHGRLRLLFIGIGHTAPARHIHVVNFDDPFGRRSIQRQHDAMGHEFNVVSYHNLVVSILCLDGGHIPARLKADHSKVRFMDEQYGGQKPSAMGC